MWTLFSRKLSIWKMNDSWSEFENRALKKIMNSTV